jgi:hypothetical protein
MTDKTVSEVADRLDQLLSECEADLSAMNRSIAKQRELLDAAAKATKSVPAAPHDTDEMCGNTQDEIDALVLGLKEVVYHCDRWSRIMQDRALVYGEEAIGHSLAYNHAARMLERVIDKFTDPLAIVIPDISMVEPKIVYRGGRRK